MPAWSLTQTSPEVTGELFWLSASNPTVGPSTLEIVTARATVLPSDGGVYASRREVPPDARVRKETNALAKAGHRIRVVCPADVVEQERYDGVTVRRFPYEPLPPSGVRDAYHLVRGRYPAWREQIARELERGVDVFHVHDLVLAETALRAIPDVPVVLDLHENYPAAVKQYRESDSLEETALTPGSPAAPAST